MMFILENALLRLEFDQTASGLAAVVNPLNGETFAIAGDMFALETTACRRTQQELRQVEWSMMACTVRVRCTVAELTAEREPSRTFFGRTAVGSSSMWRSKTMRHSRMPRCFWNPLRSTDEGEFNARHH